jgi:hypothetical protein
MHEKHTRNLKNESHPAGCHQVSWESGCICPEDREQEFFILCVELSIGLITPVNRREITA